MTDQIESKALALIKQQFDRGWAGVVRDLLGVVLDFNSSADDLRRLLTKPLNAVDRNHPRLADFAIDGNAALCASDPAHSALFHIWARPVEQGETLALPLLDCQGLDDLENYIYWLGMSNDVDGDGQIHALANSESWALATMAYTYRPAWATPHGRHADMVYSRTALTRVGTCAPEFSLADQSWSSWSDGLVDAAGQQTPKGFRVTRARLGVFLCQRIKGDPTSVGIMLPASKDDERVFYRPKRKLFPGANYAGLNTISTLEFRGHFFSDKLQRVVKFAQTTVGAGLNIDLPPFVQQTKLQCGSVEVVADAAFELRALTASCLVGPQPRSELVGVATQAADDGARRVATFKVPQRDDPLPNWLGNLIQKPGLDHGNLSWNRHYTSLMIIGSKTRLALEGIEERLEHTLPSWLYPLPKIRPRPAPEFVNIRHRVNPNGTIDTLSDSPAKDYEPTLDQGGYQAALFDDGMFDGAVWVIVNGQTSLACFVVTTAPDFFPYSDQADLQSWFDQAPTSDASQQFKEGGPMPLCSGRFVANPLLTDPWTGRALFDVKDDTVTAIVARPASEARGDAKPVGLRYLRRHDGGFLSDAASNEFAPGWDVSYDEYEGTYYYTTHGLGSPFPEDVKFCASANAYWPAASPDAARTFNRPNVPTAIPLLDDELGWHPLNPARPTGAPGTPGWDGEFGPFFEVQGTTLGVNFADIRRSDYVANARRGTFAHRVFDLDSDQLIQRMEALRFSLPRLAGKKTSVSETPYWLVSATCTRPQGTAPTAPVVYCFEFCITTTDGPTPAVSQSGQPAQPGYWRLWLPVKNRVKVECAFPNATILADATVRHADWINGDGQYGPWSVA